MTRKKLARLIGKQVKYTATIGTDVDVGGKTLCLNDIKHKGKIVTDHVWALVYKFKDFNPGDVVEFIGTAYTYFDKHKNRKTGLREINSVKRYLGDMHEEVHDAFKHIRARKNR